MTFPTTYQDDLDIPGYSIAGKIGSGNHSIIYLARQRGLHRLVALKTIAMQDTNGHAAARLRREGKIVAKLELQNVVRLHEMFEMGGRSYATFEYVEGGTLRQKLKENLPSAKDAARLAISIARTMDEVHRRGVIHLDLKPENILLTKEGEPKICDFGLAMAIGTNSEFDSIDNVPDEIIGTPWYMAPEQIEKGDMPSVRPRTFTRSEPFSMSCSPVVRHFWPAIAKNFLSGYAIILPLNHDGQILNFRSIYKRFAFDVW